MSWPKGKPRPPRVPVNAASEAATQSAAPKPKPVNQQPIREKIREGAVQARGRDGEVLTRRRTQSGDALHIPNEIIPEGWDYQWNNYTVFNEPATASRIAMAENGWRPVPAGRHPGMFMPKDYAQDGPIIRDGMILEERPMELSNEARAEELAKARNLVKDQQEQLGLSQKMPDGFSRDNSKLRALERAGTSRVFAPEPGMPRPALPIDPAV